MSQALVRCVGSTASRMAPLTLVLILSPSHSQGRSRTRMRSSCRAALLRRHSERTASLGGRLGSAGEFDVFVDTLIRELASVEPPCPASIPTTHQRNPGTTADSGGIGWFARATRRGVPIQRPGADRSGVAAKRLRVAPTNVTIARRAGLGRRVSGIGAMMGVRTSASALEG